MPHSVRSLTPSAIVVALAVSLAPAQEKLDGTKAKAAATENLKKIKIDKPTIVESDSFVIAGSMPEEKAKALAAVLEKAQAVARKAAKYDEKDTAWKGKLVVYFLPDGDEFKSYMRRVLQISPEGMHVDFRSEPAFVVDPADMPGKPTDADLYFRTATRIAGEHLRAKGTGTQVIPEWLRDGFGRVAAMRAEGTTTKRYRDYKAAARKAAFGGVGVKPPSIGEVGQDAKSAAGEALANSVAEFLAFGPKSADFGKFIEALRPSEAVGNPTLQNGFEALGWKDQAMADAAWKRWVLGR
jgi:hypothetical protein